MNLVGSVCSLVLGPRVPEALFHSALSKSSTRRRYSSGLNTDSGPLGVFWIVETTSSRYRRDIDEVTGLKRIRN